MTVNAIISFSVFASSALASYAETNFLPQVLHSVGEEPMGVVVADISRDGRLDIVTANRDDRSVTVLYGQPSGGQGGRRDFATGTRPQVVAISDFTNDGWPDLAVGGGGSRNNRVEMLRGTGGGAFSLTDSYVVGVGPSSIVAEDLNGDGVEDLAVADFYDTRGIVSVMLGKPNGTFFPAQHYDVGGRYPDTIVTGDFTRDGITDLAVSRVADVGPGSVALLPGLGDGRFAAPQQFAAGNHPRGMTVADFNGDHLPDVAAANYGSGDVTVLYGQAEGGFGPPQAFGTGDAPYDVVAGDFNVDGLPDLAVAVLSEKAVQLLYGQSGGGFASGDAYAVGIWCWDMAAADLDGNGGLDLVVSNAGNDTVSILYNTVPEPGAVALLALGGLAVMRRRRQLGSALKI